MPRRPRTGIGGHVVHALNRRAGRQTLFFDDPDYAAFERVLEEARLKVGMRLLAYCLMPNHWHLVLWPRTDEEMSQYMGWLTLTHTQRWHRHNKTSGTGALYQGRYKAFPVATDDHFYTLCRYVERNPLRANLVRRAEGWRWSSLWQRENRHCDVALNPWPLPLNEGWCDYVNQPQSVQEVAAVRACIAKSRPYGLAPAATDA